MAAGLEGFIMYNISPSKDGKLSKTELQNDMYTKLAGVIESKSTIMPFNNLLLMTGLLAQWPVI